MKNFGILIQVKFIISFSVCNINTFPTSVTPSIFSAAPPNKDHDYFQNRFLIGRIYITALKSFGSK